MAQMCPAKSTIVPFKKQMYSSGSIILSYKDDKCICVSIHAPTRGATSRCFRFSFCLSRFNPRTHEGCDIIKDDTDDNGSLFQSTHPRGVRHLVWSFNLSLMCFNPRTHEGCDVPLYVQPTTCSCFNPRTHEGCDTLFGEIVKEPQGFNPRTHEGCDFCPLF